MGKKSLVKDITYGVCGSLVDLLIWQIALVGASVGKAGPRGVHQAFIEADGFLETVNHRTLASVWHQLSRQQLITNKKRNNLYNLEITKLGRERLSNTLPSYEKKRFWDGKIYLVTYDIPEKFRKKRDKLRYFLKKIGAVLLQESIWLTPYNPRELINEFIQEQNISGTIIVSHIGPDGGIGETNIQDLLVRLFSLDKLNERYQNFIIDTKKGIMDRSLIFHYLSILKDDPQLPFKLLPKGWLGDKAYLFYEKLN
ncbi:CRISPR-associated endonuclease Cas2 [Candidatus Gottesmanbacteria bacterium RIFCSPHIGHO2_02_FULL_40_13]|uniref:CRISPR-associated endoribonuclease Cas2 n=1 Tax=Candidatus Gottesmanbacteria bacterium RIFCSPHIGHO2_02_FULL_40_13 TaxID=1798384 RepID=A0A1F6A9B2_9BACT|nr:MAG: CRISPR-associated endonuclease Cas2 [Candidatus Gottesmanbacteria bacterium RIFCSPHIGHO2_02_FULL_40_13]